MKKQLLIVAFFLLFTGLSVNAFAMDDPDLEGPIVKIDTVKNVITVKNTGPNTRLKSKEKKVLVKQGMINAFRMRDYVQIRLMADNYEAKMIQKTSPPKESASAKS